MDGQAAIERNAEALKRVVVALVAMAGRATLPRHLRNAVLRLLRPAESAARRLVIACAFGITVALPCPRKAALSRRPRPARRASRPFALLDPPGRPFRIRRACVPAHLAPRICVPGVSDPRPLPPPPSSHDQLDATPLRRRLAALAGVLDDLPRHARRFARWRARQEREAGRTRFRAPLRPGRAPGTPPAPTHDVHAILDHAHQLAWWALHRPG